MKNEMWLIWKQPTTRRRYKIGLLTFEHNTYRFQYINPELDEAREAGFRSFPGFEDIKKEYISNSLFANIDTRLPNINRPDYLEILNSNNLEIDSSKLNILKATKGRLITDTFEFVPTFDKNRIEFDVAGTRHCEDCLKCKDFINVNDKLLLELDESNEYDENAIKVILKKEGEVFHLGYVPRYYTKELSDLLRNNVQYSAMIQSINFESKFSDEDIVALVKLIFR